MMDLHINSGFNVLTRVDFSDHVTSLVSEGHRWPFETGLNGCRLSILYFLLKSQGNKTNIENPCAPTGNVTTDTYSNIFEVPCTKKKDRDSLGIDKVKRYSLPRIYFYMSTNMCIKIGDIVFHRRNQLKLGILLRNFRNTQGSHREI